MAPWKDRDFRVYKIQRSKGCGQIDKIVFFGNAQKPFDVFFRHLPEIERLAKKSYGQRPVS